MNYGKGHYFNPFRLITLIIQYRAIWLVQFWVSKVGNFWFLYPLVLSKWEDLAFSVSRLFEKSVFILQFFNDKMHNYVKQNITKNFNIKKLNNKHTFLKTEKTKFSRWENLAFSVLRKVCLFFNFWIIKHTNALNKT